MNYCPSVCSQASVGSARTCDGSHEPTMGGPDRTDVMVICRELQSLCFEIIAGSYNIYQPNIEAIEKETETKKRNHH